MRVMHAHVWVSGIVDELHETVPSAEVQSKDHTACLHARAEVVKGRLRDHPADTAKETRTDHKQTKTRPMTREER